MARKFRVIRMSYSHAHAVQLRDEERLEDFRERFRRDAVARVAHRDFDRIRPAAAGAENHLPPTAVAAVHRIHRVELEIEQHLLEMHVISPHRRQGGRGGDLDRHPACGGVGTRVRSCFGQQFIYSERARFEITPFEHGPQTIDHFACALIIVADIADDCP